MENKRKDQKLIDYAWGLVWKDEIIKEWTPVHKQLAEIYPPFEISSSGPFLYIKTTLITAKIVPTDFNVFEVFLMKTKTSKNDRTLGGIKVINHADEDDMHKEHYWNLSVEETQKLIMQKIKQEYSSQLHENKHHTINNKRKLIIKRT